MLPVTKRDYQIRRAVVHYMVTQYRQCGTQSTMNNLMAVFAQRHRVVYDHRAIPLPLMR